MDGSSASVFSLAALSASADKADAACVMLPRIAAMVRFRTATLRGWITDNFGLLSTSSGDSPSSLDTCLPNSLGGLSAPGRVVPVLLVTGTEPMLTFTVEPDTDDSITGAEATRSIV